MTHPTLNDDYYEHRITRLEAVFENVAQTLLRLESKIDENHKEMKGDLKSSNNRMDKIESKMDENFIRLENKMDKGFHYFTTRMDRLDKKVDDGFILVDKKIESTNTRMDYGFQTINSRLWSNFIWTMSGFAAILGIIAKTQHWI